MSQIYDRIKKGLPAEKEVWEKIAAYLLPGKLAPVPSWAVRSFLL